MRCIHLLDTQDFAGTERHLLLLVQRLRMRRIDASIGCRAGSALQREAVSLQIPTVVLGDRPGPKMMVAFLRHVRRERYDLIHSHNGRTLLMAAIAHSLTGVPVFATQHFITPWSTTYRGTKRIVSDVAHRWVNRRVTRFAAVSEAARSAMLDREGVPPDQVVTIVNGIEPLVPPSTERIAAVRAELGVSAGTLLVVTVARLVREKGIADLIDAVPLVGRSVANIVFLVVGEGALAGELHAQAARVGTGDALRFVGFRADATDVIAAADLFLLPSPGEPFGLVLLEAMALARPVLATAAGGPLEIVVDGQTGRLVPPSNPAAMAAAVIELLRRPEQLREMGAAGLERFRRCFTADRMAAATEALYDGTALVPVAASAAVA
jgi:glycosyltransferase involved in cell wall biosynthesis